MHISKKIECEALISGRMDTEKLRNLKTSHSKRHFALQKHCQIVFISVNYAPNCHHKILKSVILVDTPQPQQSTSLRMKFINSFLISSPIDSLAEMPSEFSSRILKASMSSEDKSRSFQASWLGMGGSG